MLNVDHVYASHLSWSESYRTIAGCKIAFAKEFYPGAKWVLSKEATKTT